MSSDSLKFSNSVIVAPLVAVLSIWIVFWVEMQLGINLNEYGVYPRRLSGLQGVFFSPFIHGSIEHLYNNTIPLAVLTAFLFYFYRSAALRVLLIGALSLVVVFIYGSMIWYIFPVKDGISWEGHLAGFFTGLALAFVTKIQVPEVRKYDWEREDYREEDDPFLKHFDANGNFIESTPEEPEEKIEIKYHYKKLDDD